MDSRKLDIRCRGPDSGWFHSAAAIGFTRFQDGSKCAACGNCQPVRRVVSQLQDEMGVRQFWRTLCVPNWSLAQ